jgi:hypothetical protein
MTQPERGGLGRVSAGSGAIVMYPHRCISARFVPVRARPASSPTVIPPVVMNRRQIHSNSHGFVVKRVPRGAYDWLYILAADGCEYLIEECLQAAGR